MLNLLIMQIYDDDDLIKISKRVVGYKSKLMLAQYNQLSLAKLLN